MLRGRRHVHQYPVTKSKFPSINNSFPAYSTGIITSSHPVGTETHFDHNAFTHFLVVTQVWLPLVTQWEKRHIPTTKSSLISCSLCRYNYIQSPYGSRPHSDHKAFNHSAGVGAETHSGPTIPSHNNLYSEVCLFCTKKSHTYYSFCFISNWITITSGHTAYFPGVIISSHGSHSYYILLWSEVYIIYCLQLILHHQSNAQSHRVSISVQIFV